MRHLPGSISGVRRPLALLLWGRMKRAILLSLFTQLTWAQINDISGERMRAHVKFLASDLLEGRGVGARGGDLATEYIATQFALAGLKPAGDHGSYYQQVPLIGVETEPGAKLSASTDGRQIEFKWADEFVGVNERQTAQDQFKAEAIF